MSGPLEGITIVELAGIGPGPFACMMLADHGADVIQVKRKVAAADRPEIPETEVLGRSRKTIEVDLKSRDGIEVVLDLLATADGLVEGFRPGVAERLGVGPDVALKRNPALVYGRMTGWGQAGPLAGDAGHDIDYIAISGTLHAVGRAGQAPTPPINLVGDFGGGGMFLAFGMVSALLHARKTGVGQTIDCAMTDGSALLMSMMWGFRAAGRWQDERGVNFLDTGAPFYDTYETSDGRHVALGSIEAPFYERMRAVLGIADDPSFDRQMDQSLWPAQRQRIAEIIAGHTRAEWCQRMDGRDCCFAPVLSMAEAIEHPHNIARKTFIEVESVVQPAPAPRYSVTATSSPRAARGTTDAAEVLASIGYDEYKISSLLSSHCIA